MKIIEKYCDTQANHCTACGLWWSNSKRQSHNKGACPQCTLVEIKLKIENIDEIDWQLLCLDIYESIVVFYRD